MVKTINLLNDEARRLNVYHLEDYEQFFMDDPSKPSARIYQTKKGRKAIEGLKMIQKDYNISWYKAVKNRWVDSMDKEFIFYRGNSISAAEAFKKADQLAEALAYIGIQKGDEIPCCLGNIPETVYLMLAVNKLGAKVNFFGAHYDPKFIDIILSQTSHKLFIASDEYYGQVKDAVAKQDFLYKMVISLADSLPKYPEECPEYEPELDSYYRYENKAQQYIAEDISLMSWPEFLELSSNFTGEIVDDNDLYTEFLVTYTSGSTKVGFPKRMIHCNRSPICVGVFHDPDLCGNPAKKGLRSLAHIHTDSNTNLITSISDAFFQNWSVAMEPEYDREHFIDILFLDKPNVCIATTSFYIETARRYLIEGKYNDRKLGFLLSPLCVGEGTAPGEEKFINKFLKESKAGSSVSLAGPIHFPYVTIGIGGGDTEHGGIYYTLWKGFYQKLNKFKLKGESFGMRPVPYVQVTVLRKDESGQYVECDYNEKGIIVANSFTNLSTYKSYEKVQDKIITDNKGRDWLSCDVFGFIDSMGNVHMKDRRDSLVTMENGDKVYPFRLADVASEDDQNILTAVVTETEYEGRTHFVINYEVSPLANLSADAACQAMDERLKAAFPQLHDRILYRYFNDVYLFPLTGSGKRNVVEVANKGYSHTFRLEDGKKTDVK